MTIAICVKVDDGVVLAADSASTIIRRDNNGNLVVHNVYRNANKIFNLNKRLPIGVITWGVGSIGQQSVATLMKDLRLRLSGGDSDYLSWELKGDYKIREVAQRLREFIFDEKYQAAFAEWDEKPALGFLVAGFSPKESLAEVYQIDIKDGACSDPVPFWDRGEPGIIWNGESEAISRLLLGYSDAVLNVLSKSLKLNDDQVRTFRRQMQPYQAQLVVAAMPIIDAIDLANFLAEMTINYSRFSPGATTVDEPVEIAAITKHEGFKWIKRKHYFSTDLNPVYISKEHPSASTSQQS